VNRLLFLSGHCIPFLLTGQEFGALNRPSIHERLGCCDKGPRVVDADASSEQPGVEFEGNIFARGRDTRQEWYWFYKTLVQLRRYSSELTRGAFAWIDVGEHADAASRTIVAFERRLNHSTIRCAVNLGPEPRCLERSEWFDGPSLYGAISEGTLEPFAAIVVRVND